MNQLAGILVGLFGGGVIGTLGSGVIAGISERRSHWRDDRRKAYGDFIAAMTTACDSLNYLVSAQRELNGLPDDAEHADQLSSVRANLESYAKAASSAAMDAASAYRIARLLMTPATDRSLMSLIDAFNDLLWAAKREAPWLSAAGFAARPESVGRPFDEQMHAVFDEIRTFIGHAQDDMNLRAWWRR